MPLRLQLDRVGRVVRRAKKAVRRAVKSPGKRVSVLVAGAVLLGVCLSIAHWNWLQGGTEHTGNSAVVRNIALVIGGVVAIVIAVWRSLVAENQARVAQHGLLNERYQKGAEMLGSSVVSVRVGGIYALRSLAEDHPQQYGVQILRLLCMFVRHPTGRIGAGDSKEAPADIQAAVETVIDYDRSTMAWARGLLDFHGAHLWFVNLAGADLTDANLTGADLASADLTGVFLRNAALARVNLTRALLGLANLVGADLRHANLTGARLAYAKLMKVDMTWAKLINANLAHADLTDADLTSADLTGASLRGADLTNATVKQSQLDLAVGDDSTRLPNGLSVSPRRKT